MILDRYLIRQIGSSFLTVAVVLTSVFLVFSLTRFLEDASSGLLSAAEVTRLTLFKSLVALEVLLPLAFYFAIIVGLGRLNATNELTVMRACGAGGARVLRPLLMLCLLLATGVAALSLVARPWAYGHMYALKEGAEAASELNRIKPQRFYLYEDGERTVYVEHIGADGHALSGIFIRSEEDAQREIITAPSGRLEPFATPAIHRLTLSQASIYRLRPGERDLHARFESLSLALDATRTVDHEYRTKSAPTAGLLRSDNGDDRAELQWRLSTPLSTLLLTIAALAMIDYQPRQSRFARMPLAIAVYAVYYNLLGLGRNWVEQGLLNVIWWVPAGLALTIAATFYVRRSQFD